MRKWFVFLMAAALLVAGCSGRSGNAPAAPPIQARPESQAPSSLPEQSQSSKAAEAAAPGAGEAPSHGIAISPPEGDVVEISERLFIAQTNDIYINTEDYLGKTIKYEGIFKTMYWPEENETFYYVIRYGPGCCGYDGEAGFEVSWDGEWPEEDAWCEAVGVLEAYEMNGWQYLRLALSSLTVLEERGAEFVSS